MLAVLVFGLVDGFDDVGVFLGILTDDGSRPVGRGIVVDDSLEGEVGLLHYKAVQALPQVWLMIINKALN